MEKRKEQKNNMMTQEQFANAYETGCQRTMGFLLAKGLPESEAAETAQAAWARGWEHREQLRDSDKAVTWVNSIALNLFRTRLRRNGRMQEMPEIAVAPKSTGTEVDVHRMLHRCKPNERKLLEAHYLEGYDIADLARRHNCTRTAIRVRLVRARRTLREKFEQVPAAVHCRHSRRAA